MGIYIYISIFLLLATTACCQKAISAFCKKYVIVEFAHRTLGMSDPAAMEFIMRNTSKIRNYYFPMGTTSKGPRPLFAPTALTHLIASKTNATLILNDSVPESRGGNNGSEFPRVLPPAPSHGYGSANISSIWQNYYHPYRKLSNLDSTTDSNPTKLPYFSFHKASYETFYYYDLPRKMRISPWTFTLFTGPFDALIWLILIMTFVLLTAVVLT